MEIKSLKNIQTISRVGRVLSKIVFIFSIIGGIGCAIGAAVFSAFPQIAEMGGIDASTLFGELTKAGMGTAMASMSAGVFLCAGEAVLAGFAEKYFKREIAAGTPFTIEGSKELFRLGILTVCIPIASYIAASTAYNIIGSLVSGVSAFDAENEINISLGIMFCITSVICRYGYDITAGKEGTVNGSDTYSE